MQIELRTNKTQLSSTEDGENLKVAGYVNKTNEPSEVLGTSKKFVEKISRGAFSKAISRAKEIDFLAEHSSEKLLSSTRNGSLYLKEDNEGLWIEAIITPTSYGKDTYELIKTGIFRNMSFGFKVVKDNWRAIENGLYERTIEDLDLFEVSVVKNPAYSQSTISARNLQVRSADEIIKNIRVAKEDTNMKKNYYPSLNERLDPIKEKRSHDYKEFKDYLNEERTLQSTIEGMAIAPTSVEKEIILSIEENSPIFEFSRKLQSKAGTLKIAVESGDSAEAGFVGEGVSLKELAISLDEVKLEQKRVGAAISLTNHLIHDSAIDIVEYCAKLLGRRVAKVVEKSIFVGQGGTEFNGIVNDEKVPTVNSQGEMTIDTIMDLYNTVHPEFHAGAAFYMSHDMYKTVSQMKDARGQFYLQNGVVNGKPTRTLLGSSIYVTSALEGASSEMIFCNAHEAVAVMVKQAVGLQLIVDTENALKGIKTLVFDMYLDSAVVNHQAIAKLI